ncbi:MAG: Ppx/GppA family phosphatase [Deltaproteobacteria bacterium]|nr:Ppx/GppA family phosphatase [Deltaproteobacteria bacterium]
MARSLASIDIGTNTFRLLISELNDDGQLRQRVIKREITRLGGGFTATGGLTGDSMLRGIATLSAFSELLREHKVEEARAVATSVVREAPNGREFVRMVKDLTGLNVEVIDGDEEALLALKGVLSCITVKTGDALVFDIGGGSAEYILSSLGNPLYSESLKLGVVHATETFLHSDPTKEEEIEKVSNHVVGILKPFLDNLVQNGLKKRLPPENMDVTLIGTAGTITTLAAMDQGLESYDPSRINNYVLTYNRVKRLLNDIYPLALSERSKVFSLERGREDLIVAGAVIVLKTMEIFGFREMMVSDGGLLEGVLIDMVQRKMEGVIEAK